eukprot:gene4104-16042_t
MTKWAWLDAAGTRRQPPSGAASEQKHSTARAARRSSALGRWDGCGCGERRRRRRYARRCPQRRT